MGIPLNELQVYSNFEEMANDVLQMANEFMQDRVVYITTMTDSKQTILKVLDNQTGSLIPEGLTLDLFQTVCSRVDSDNNSPLIFEDISSESCFNHMREALAAAKVNSYVGVPIILNNGKLFGTLCAVHPAAVTIEHRKVEMFQRIARMFAYYLDLERLAYRDSLTGLYNRQFLHKYFSDHPSKSGAIFFLDLDGFKQVNDIHGHDVGDLVLKEAGNRLEEYMKQEKGFAVRLGGDEFIIDFHEPVSHETMIQHAEAILARLSRWDTPFEDFQLSVSIGLVSYTLNDSGNLNEVLKNADNALYRAKANGKNTYQIF